MIKTIYDAYKKIFHIKSHSLPPFFVCHGFFTAWELLLLCKCMPLLFVWYVPSVQHPGLNVLNNSKDGRAAGEQKALEGKVLRM